MKRTFAIGDIHGGLRALHQLLERINPNDEDTFIFLGDYVDGWSESAQVIDFLIDFDEMYDCVFIKGNHDIWIQEWLRTGFLHKNWSEESGGTATIKSYQGINIKTKWKHADFLQSTKFYHLDEQKRLFLHAGFTAVSGVLDEHDEGNFCYDRTLWEMALCMDSRIEKNAAVFPKRLKLYHEIFIGHTPTLNYNVDVPMQGCNVWNIDTGAAFLGKLSAIDIDTKEVFQSDAVWSLYPDEKGRN